ncbi:glycosyltransferase family 39 protein [Solitalea canadensis]|uniref:PMT family glycosyltransferase, 4-amino-4-deoxy-L-arabinose transferase n=1 Tax=Solitalea canadensis (strain ATCC 29591 / DSM 3403 / JCM 21819 / LMG 8368 / NBRC 15130 / NCIMB 12057 / USAM 9D) TaxID=929556 RepID=H8KWP5_SOLCM|nr:glycosyltransferase family 39 protein [Solitalea canadensis]AFD08224.1 PMT family glycosyltransferase, 4-amino-4-deoxy-L-arabinose transferase [Solitalea canadensis DSM 3403]
MDQPISNRTYNLLFTLSLIVYFTGLCFPLLEPDANEYACIAMRMYQQHDFVDIISRSVFTFKEYDYLDKPHLLFWLSGLSFKLFGLHDWVYRLPSLLFTILATYSTYSLGKLLYNKEIGKIAALIFITSQSIIIANHDVRTDSLLTSFLILGIWQLTRFLQTDKLAAIIIGSAAIALAVATKGMIAVIVAGSALVCYVIYQREWRTFLNCKWLIGLLSFFVALSPFLYCYYLQFDLHPEKLVNGKYNQSGIKFLLWTQSAERFAGNRDFVSSPEFSFFYHTLLWAILPWSFLVYTALVGRIKAFWDARFRKTGTLEFLTLGGILIVFHLMSASQFKLPHYLNVLFPLFAILCASYLYNLVKNNNHRLLNILEKLQLFTIGVLLIFAYVLNFWFFPIQSIWLKLTSFVLLTFLFYLIIRSSPSGVLYRIIVPSAFAILSVNLLLNTNFYPQLMHYQAGSEMALIAKKNAIPVEKTFIYKKLLFSFDFYSGKTIPALNSVQIITKSKTGERFYLFLRAKDFTDLPSGLTITRRLETPHFHVSQLKYEFLNPATRSQAIEAYYLLQFN